MEIDQKEIFVVDNRAYLFCACSDGNMWLYDFDGDWWKLIPQIPDLSESSAEESEELEEEILEEEELDEKAQLLASIKALTDKIKK